MALYIYKHRTMKNTIFITAILFALSCKAQTPIVSFTDYCENNHPRTFNMYVKDIEGFLTPYVGTWKWQNGNDMLMITLFKAEMVHNGDRYDDELHGKMKYVKNGREVFNTLVNGPDVLESYDCIPIDNEYRFSFKDPIKAGKYGEVYITLLDNNTKIKFYLVNNEGPKFTFPGEPPFDWEFSMPRRTEFVLNKL